MEDSFFGFDTTAPLDDDGGGQIAEPSEEEYDALNDETFGSAINGDWEEVHENLVRLNDNVNGQIDEHKNSVSKIVSKSSQRNKNELESDLEINLSGMRLDDVEIARDDSEGGINLDPSVWANTLRPSNISQQGKTQVNLFSNSRELMRNQFLNTLQSKQRQELEHTQKHSPSVVDAEHLKPQNASSFPKICTLEDIERSIIIQQTMQKQQLEQQQQQQQQTRKMLQGNNQNSDINSSKEKQPMAVQKHQLSQLPLTASPALPPPTSQSLPGKQAASAVKVVPPGFAAGPQRHNYTNFGPSSVVSTPMNSAAGGIMNSQHPQHRMPPGFPTVPLFPPGLSPIGHPHQQQTHLQNHPPPGQQQLPNFPRPMSNLPIALNNFVMHPNFNVIRPLQGPSIAPPRLPPHPNMMNNAPPAASVFNMFNMRLVQEIQQNHPMLNARHGNVPISNGCTNNFNLPLSASSSIAAGLNNIHNIANNNLQMQHHFHQQQLRNKQQQPHHIQNMQYSLQQQQQNQLQISPGFNHQQMRSNGNLPEENDEYANLMSNRDKHWLIGIQLSQLNTDTPYIDDYYYTIFKERKAMLNGDSRQSRTHKDNQLNHPLTQPKGHAQLILVQLGNKNGNNNRNGQNRERKNSENNKNSDHHQQDQQRKYVYTPLKFENSLGKLQYGSVTAPRKIIDMEVMGNDGNGIGTRSSGGGGSLGSIVEISAQRKSRHILLHIETLYRIVLKLEDLNNPDAIATIVTKKKKENERILALEQMENMNKTPEERAAENNCPSQMNPALKNKFAYEIEPKEALISKLIAGLTHDKIVAMMNVRKGKALIRRIMFHIQDNPIRWNVWMGVFTSLQFVLKKDRDDTDGVLYALYPEFKKHVKLANFEAIVKLSSSIPLSDKKSNGLFCSKFGISSLVCLILQAEKIYVTNTDTTLDEDNKESWKRFLDTAATSLNRTIQNQIVCAAIESDSIQPMIDHFARFKDLKLDSLLALTTEAKQQIN